jgi:endoglucanase
MIAAVTPRGVVADWVTYKSDSTTTGGFIADSIKGDQGSYDAIRVYLWAGMTPEDDPLAKKIMNSLSGMGEIVALKDTLPESLNADTGICSGTAPLGFSAALLPYLKTNHQETVLKSQLERAYLLQYASPPPNYYNSVLSLFGSGWLDNRYRFSSNGLINLNWNLVCAPKAS